MRTGRAQRNQVVGIQGTVGDPRWLSVTTAPATGPDGLVDFVVTSMTDISTEHCARQELLRAAGQRRRRIIGMLESSELQMVFQPIVALDDGRIAGFEALARFPRRPAAAAGPVVRGRGRRGPRRRPRAQGDQRRARHPLQLPDGAYLSVNASPLTAMSPALLSLLADAPGGRIILELTEHADVEDYEALSGAVARLRDHGVRLAVDDAGAGFASLRHILNLQPDIIKLDIALTRGIDADPARRALASALLRFGAEMEAVLVAEGIETAGEREALTRLGIEFGQGYLLGRPQPAAQLDRTPAPVL